MTYRLGIDAGSKTIKLVLLDQDDRTVFSQYSLHKSDIRSTMLTLLHDTIWRFGDAEVITTVTGSAGMRIADILDLPFVQEVIATKHAIGQLYPQADVAIELGGEDAKIIYLTDGVEQRMNGSCAGGTGGFIDLMCATLGVRAKEMNSLALGFSTVYPIASRCAVFAQTDVRPLLNEGARKSDIAASILQAVVTQTVAGLSCGRPIKGTVVFLGGPLQVYPELVSRFRRTLGLTHAQTIKPPDAHLFVAMGAALLGKDSSRQPIPLSELEQRLKAAPEQEDGGIERLAPLFSDDEELQAFRQRHEQSRVSRRQLMNYSGDAFLGIDAGSTTCKLVLVGSEGELLYSDYEKSRGNVIGTLSDMLEELYSSIPREYDGSSLVTVRHTKVTGYGEQLLRVAFNADSGEVETIAHLRAARELDPEVDFVLDIGGQDIKCLRIRNGVIDDVILNEACSSGCGALIEGFSRSLGYTQWSFSDLALQSKRPVDLGTRCTVFMTSRVRHAQKEGIPTSDIAAGLAFSVVRNALYKVIGYTDAEQLGKHMVVQGGTFMSDAVLRAFELECGCEVTRPNIANLMGAYGAALLSRDEVLAERKAGCAPERTNLLDPCELASLNQKHATRRCMGCANNCLLTISSFNSQKADDTAARVFLTGNRCEKGALTKQVKQKPANLFAFERQLLAAYDTEAEPKSDVTDEDQKRRVSQDQSMTGAQSGEQQSGVSQDKPVIGIPRALDLYASFPFWRTFFKQLGFEVKSIPASSPALYRSGAQAVMSEAVCFPAKLAHGHVAQLIEQGVDIIFMPTGASICDSLCVGKSSYGGGLMDCPVSSEYALLIADDVVERGEGAVGFLTVDLRAQTAAADSPANNWLSERLKNTLNQQPACNRLLQPITQAAIKSALDAARVEQRSFEQQLQQKADEVLATLHSEGKKGIVLAGHPYHVDPGISHGIDELLVSLGFAVFSIASISHLDIVAASGNEHSDDFAGMVAGNWRQTRALYRAALQVVSRPELEMVHIYSFGCGVDALATMQLRELLEGSNRIYTALKIDEMVDLAAIRIRLRSLAAALREREQADSANPAEGARSLEAGRPPFVASGTGKAETGSRVVVVPSLAPEHLNAIRPLLAAQAIRLEILDPINQQDVETGQRYCDNDLCQSMIALAGQVIKWASESTSDENITVLVPQVCSGCRSIELETIVRRWLRRSGNTQNIETIGFPGTNSQINLNPALAATLHTALEQVVTPDTISLTPPLCSTGLDPKICQDEDKPRIAVLGNASLLFTPFLNRQVIQHIVNEGCTPVLPAITSLLLTNAPLENQIEQMVACGALDIIYAQSFGCLSGHIHARGALKRIKRRFPQVNITFIDYDSGASEINQINRLKLAVTLARERHTDAKSADIMDKTTMIAGEIDTDVMLAD